ncbi:sensor histidine kinase [Paenibacillus turpanensis]|uniref:sensor histidine kinase n=1 Tax=Paenibacillus turpanensis TaxID=2689078 RepID=UPI00140DEBF7|nr:ATP-binding protein [Paenibacillus turpanensis]
MNINRSIFRKLLFSFTATVLLGLCAVGLLLSYYTKDYITESKKAELLRQAKKINLSLQNMPVMDEDAKQLLMFFDQSFDTRIWVFDEMGQIVATSSKEEVYVGKSVDPSIVRKVSKGEDAVLNLQFEGLKETMLSVSVPWGKGNVVYGGIVLHAPITGISETITYLRETILWVTLFGLVVSITMASVISWTISRPLRAIDMAAAKIALGDYSERLEIKSKDEIGDLAETINHMVEKLAKIDAEKRKLESVRSDFLANVSHELRTPLTAMQGFLEALQDDLIEETGRAKYYEIMYNETLHMNRLVDDMLDLMKMENNEITLFKTGADMEALMQKSVFKFGPEANERGTELQLRVERGLPKAYADPDRVEQIFNNLITNAVKFTENGVITLSAVKDGRDIVIRVEDTGEGISAEDQEMIWERFFKVDRGRSKKYGGTGLGLAIVKRLVELHDGTISVHSELGRGTTFEVRIPSLEGREGRKLAASE